MSFYRNESVENLVHQKILGHRPVPLLLEKIGSQWLLGRLKCRKNCRDLTQLPLITTNSTVFIMTFLKAEVPSRDHPLVMRWEIYSAFGSNFGYRTATMTILNHRHELQKKPRSLGLDHDFLTKCAEKSINLKVIQSKILNFVQISKSCRKFAEDYVKGRASRVSADSRGSSDRTQSRVSFADHLPQRSRNRSQERDKNMQSA